jgi:hypothetical protein
LSSPLVLFRFSLLRVICDACGVVSMHIRSFNGLLNACIIFLCRYPRACVDPIDLSRIRPQDFRCVEREQAVHGKTWDNVRIGRSERLRAYLFRSLFFLVTQGPGTNPVHPVLAGSQKAVLHARIVDGQGSLESNKSGHENKKRVDELTENLPIHPSCTSDIFQTRWLLRDHYQLSCQLSPHISSSRPYLARITRELSMGRHHTDR